MLRELMERELPLVKDGKGADGVEEALTVLLRYSTRTWSHRFMDKLYTGASPIGVIGEMVTAVLNTNVHVYSVSPLMTMFD